MPIDLIRRRAVPATAKPDAVSLKWLVIVAAALAALHLASASMFEWSRARPASLAALDAPPDEAMCADRVEARAPALPFD